MVKNNVRKKKLKGKIKSFLKDSIAATKTWKVKYSIYLKIKQIKNKKCK